MVRNDNDYIKHVKMHKKKINYMKALEALRKSRNENPAYHVKMLLKLTYLRFKEEKYEMGQDSVVD